MNLHTIAPGEPREISIFDLRYGERSGTFTSIWAELYAGRRSHFGTLACPALDAIQNEEDEEEEDAPALEAIEVTVYIDNWDDQIHDVGVDWMAVEASIPRHGMRTHARL